MMIVQVSVGSVRMPPKEGSAPLQVIFNTSKHLARLGQQVVILDRRYTKDDPAVEQLEGVELVRLKAVQVPFSKAPKPIRFVLAELNAALFALSVSNYLRKNSSKIDVIHLHLTSVGLIVSTLNRSLRGKMAYTCHLGQWELARGKIRVFERLHLMLDSYLMRRVRVVIAGSESAKEIYISLGRVKADNVVIVPNGVDTELFSSRVKNKETLRTRYALQDNIIVLYVGRLAKIKGVEYLVKSANIIVSGLGRKDVIFLILGSVSFDAVEKPIDMAEMQAYIEQHQLQNNVVFTGALSNDEVRALYAASDIFVLPSLVEANPLVILEAMASGKPLIGTKVGGIPHQIKDGWNGYLVEPGNEQQLAERICLLIDNPRERQRMGLNSETYAREEFDWKKVARRLLTVYQSA